jgi:hypothetical protein
MFTFGIPKICTKTVIKRVELIEGPDDLKEEHRSSLLFHSNRSYHVEMVATALAALATQLFTSETQCSLA